MDSQELDSFFFPEGPRDWFDEVPQVELHVHLEGAIACHALWEPVLKYGGDASIPDLHALKRHFAYRDFPQFIDTGIWKNQFLREYEDFTFIAAAVADDLARQNILYAEAFYSPSDFERHGLEVQRLTDAIRTGLSRVASTEVALVADPVRDGGPARAAVTLAAVHEARALGVVGIGIGGSEQRFPPAPFQPVYAEARRLGFHTSAHAGEAAGAASIWGAVRELQVERIGHGTRAGEDERLLDYLAETRQAQPFLDREGGVPGLPRGCGGLSEHASLPGSGGGGLPMTRRAHVQLYLACTAAWAFFWAVGLPSYYQQYSRTFMIWFDALVLIPLCAALLPLLRRAQPARRMRLSLWMAFYFTVPVAIYDWLYCGVLLGHGLGFVLRYWYLSVYYVIPWLLLPGLAAALNRRGTAQDETRRDARRPAVGRGSREAEHGAAAVTSPAEPAVAAGVPDCLSKRKVSA